MRYPIAPRKRCLFLFLHLFGMRVGDEDPIYFVPCPNKHILYDFLRNRDEMEACFDFLLVPFSFSLSGFANTKSLHFLYSIAFVTDSSGCCVSGFGIPLESMI